MFNDLIRKIKIKLAEIKYKRSIDLRSKYFFIRNAVVSYYADYDGIYDVCDIPAHLKADRILADTIKRPADVDRIYKKLLKYQATMGGV